jgi:ribosome-associated protein
LLHSLAMDTMPAPSGPRRDTRGRTVPLTLKDQPRTAHSQDTRPTMPRSTEPPRKGKPAPKTAATKIAAKIKAKPPSKAAAPKISAKKSAIAKPVSVATDSAPLKAKAKLGKAEATPVVENAGGELATAILKWLDDAKAEEIVAIDLRGKTSIGDCMIIASGRSDRHVGAIADDLKTQLKDYGVANVRVEGTETCDWVLVDVGAVVVNVFRPDVRTYYNLEKMWMADRPGEQAEATH